jgi:hypothetical protein
MSGQLSPEQLRNKQECEEHIENQRRRLDVRATTKCPSGHVLDWIPVESQGEMAEPPPNPPADQEGDMPKASLADPELEMEGVERGPAGTVPVSRLNLQGSNFTKSLAQLQAKTGPPDGSQKTELTEEQTFAAPAAAGGTHWYASSSQPGRN